MRRRRYGDSQRHVCGVVLLLLGLAGCAFHAPPPAPPAGTAHLYIVRTVTDGLDDLIPLEIDQNVFVTLTPQTYIEISLEPGLHTVTSFFGDYTVTMSVAVPHAQPSFVHLTPLDRGNNRRVGFERLEDAVGRAAVQQAIRVQGSLRRRISTGEHR